MTSCVTRSDISVSAPRGGILASALATRSKRRSEPRAYDFRRPTKLSREHVRVLQIAQEAFARQGTTVLTTMLRTGTRLDLLGIEQFAYDEYIATLDDPMFIVTFSLDPLPGKGMLAFPLDSAMACIDHMLGGPGTGEQPSRPMTGMETTLISTLIVRLLKEMSTTFASFARLDPEINGFETNPQLAQTAAGSETVVVGKFNLIVGLRETEATLCLPFSSFDQALTAAARPQLSESDKRKRVKAEQDVIKRLTQVPLGVGVRFNPLPLSSEDLLALTVGNVLMLRHPISSPLEVTTNDQVFAHALHGNHRRRLVAHIVPTPTVEKDPS